MKNILTYLFVVGHLAVAAQELVFSSELEVKKLTNIEGVVSEDYIISKAQADESIIFYAINAQNNSIVQHKIRRQSSSLAGVTSLQDEIFIYFTSYDFGIDRLECLTFSKTKGKFTKLRELKKTFKKQHVCFMNDNNSFYSLSYKKREHKLLLYGYAQGVVKDTLTFDFSDERISKTLEQKGGLTNSVKTFTFIEKGREIPFDQAKNLNKVYLSENKVLIISDEREGIESGEILVLELDLTTESVVSRIVTLPYTNKTDHNSFFLDNKLFVIGIDKSMMDLTVFDIHQFEKLDSHRYLKGESIQFKASKLEKDGVVAEKVWDGTWDKEDAAKLILKSLNEGLPVISVTARNADYRLLIGSCDISQSGPVPMTVTSGGSSINTPRGTVSTPSTTQMTSTRVSTSESQTYFYGYLKKSDLGILKEHVPSDHGVFYKIKIRINELDSKIKLGGEGVINSAEASYLLYIDKQKKRMIIEKFID